jgi:hypothetical protein
MDMLITAYNIRVTQSATEFHADLSPTWQFGAHVLVQDRAQDRAHATDHPYGEHDNNQVRSHQRHIYAECFDQLRVFGPGAQVCAELGFFDDEPGS